MSSKSAYISADAIKQFVFSSIKTIILYGKGDTIFEDIQICLELH